METKALTQWTIDPAHSEVGFKVKHLVISTVSGQFEKFDGSISMPEGDFTAAEVSFSAETASINTGIADRDNHLRSDDFFNSEKYPNLTFKSTDIQKTGEDTYKLTGDLTIRDITQPVTLDVTYGGTAEDAYGNNKAGFELLGKISRKSFNLKWNGITEAGKIVVSDEVKLILDIQLMENK